MGDSRVVTRGCPRNQHTSDWISCPLLRSYDSSDFNGFQLKHYVSYRKRQPSCPATTVERSEARSTSTVVLTCTHLPELRVYYINSTIHMILLCSSVNTYSGAYGNCQNYQRNAPRIQRYPGHRRRCTQKATTVASLASHHRNDLTCDGSTM